MKRNRENIDTVMKYLEIEKRMFEESIYFYGIAVIVVSLVSVSFYVYELYVKLDSIIFNISPG